jgi:2-polyprenyl-6-methoxyphenol hydroxylase-like FAD-dependent oxidoreductase
VIERGRVVGVRCEGQEHRARLVVGADGRNSQVAKAVGAEEYHTTPRLQYSYFPYFSGLPTSRLETFIRPDRGFACAPTHDGLTMVVLGWPYDEARAYKADVAGNFRATLDLAPDFATRATTRTRSPRRASPTPSWTPSGASTRSATGWRTTSRSTTR